METMALEEETVRVGAYLLEQLTNSLKHDTQIDTGNDHDCDAGIESLIE